MCRKQQRSVLKVIETTQGSTGTPRSVKALKLPVRSSATGAVHRLSPGTTVPTANPTNAQCLPADSTLRLFR